MACLKCPTRATAELFALLAPQTGSDIIDRVHAHGGTFSAMKGTRDSYRLTLKVSLVMQQHANCAGQA